MRKGGWADLRVVSLGLPPCACCHQDSTHERDAHETGTVSPEAVGTSTGRCGNTAHGFTGTVREEESNGDGDVPEAGLAKVVFAVNAGCPIPTRRLVDAFILLVCFQHERPSRQLCYTGTQVRTERAIYKWRQPKACRG